MIARIWHGCVPASRAEAYLSLMRTVALPEYHSTDGNAGAWCLTRVDGELVHFEMFSLWESLESIRNFAGAEVERAKYYDFDKDFLIELEPMVRHYDAHSS